MNSQQESVARETIDAFLRRHIQGTFQVVKVVGDASFRSYYRVIAPHGSANATLPGQCILMDAPPDKENSAPFVDIAHFLHPYQVPVPQLFVQDLDQGYILLEDFGDTTFLQALDQGVAADTLYGAAVEALLAIQATPCDGRCIAHRRPFDREMQRRELALFTDWYIEGILKTPIKAADRVRFDKIFHRIIDCTLSQPQTFVHRDYHSRNLMWRGTAAGVGVLDFQDAVMGPITYDLASLLRDCYVAWDAPFRERIIQLWLDGAAKRLHFTPDRATFMRDFDWMSVQRNLKAVGIFGRLSLRDGKHGYLNDIPRTMRYVRENLARYPELAPLSHLVESYLPAPEAQP